MDSLNSTVVFAGLYSLPALLVLAAGAQIVRLYVGNAVACRPDPHLGRKLALHTLASVAIGLLLAAASVSVLNTAEWVVPRPAAPAGTWWNSSQRTAAGLAASGLLHLLVCEAVLRLGTNDRRFPRVRRAAAGLRFAAAAGACLVLSTAGFCMAFAATDPTPTELAYGVGLAGVWFPVAVAHYWLMTRPDAADGEPEPR